MSAHGVLTLHGWAYSPHQITTLLCQHLLFASSLRLNSLPQAPPVHGVLTLRAKLFSKHSRRVRLVSRLPTASSLSLMLSFTFKFGAIPATLFIFILHISLRDIH